MKALAAVALALVMGCATGTPRERSCNIYLPAVYATLVDQGEATTDDEWAAYDLLREELCG